MDMLQIAENIHVFNQEPTDRTPYGNAILLVPYKKGFIGPGETWGGQTIDNLLVLETVITPAVVVSYHGIDEFGKAFHVSCIKDISIGEDTLDTQLSHYLYLLQNTEGLENRNPASVAVVRILDQYSIRTVNDLARPLEYYWHLMLRSRANEFNTLANCAFKDARHTEYGLLNRRKKFTYQLMIDGISLDNRPEIPKNMPNQRVLYPDQIELALSAK